VQKHSILKMQRYREKRVPSSKVFCHPPLFFGNVAKHSGPAIWHNVPDGFVLSGTLSDIVPDEHFLARGRGSGRMLCARTGQVRCPGPMRGVRAMAYWPKWRKTHCGWIAWNELLGGSAPRNGAFLTPRMHGSHTGITLVFCRVVEVFAVKRKMYYVFVPEHKRLSHAFPRTWSQSRGVRVPRLPV
jgi:hypothetical protein